MSKVLVPLPGKEYDVIIEKGLLKRINHYLPPGHEYVIITDDNIPKKYVQTISPLLNNPLVLYVPEGEHSKTVVGIEETLVISLSVGTHTIGFRAQDNEGMWSAYDRVEIEVIPAYDKIPTASIISVSPTEPMEGEPITIAGEAHDQDHLGDPPEIVAYEWTDTINGSTVVVGDEDTPHPVGAHPRGAATLRTGGVGPRRRPGRAVLPARRLQPGPRPRRRPPGQGPGAQEAVLEGGRAVQGAPAAGHPVGVLRHHAAARGDRQDRVPR